MAAGARRPLPRTRDAIRPAELLLEYLWSHPDSPPQRSIRPSVWGDLAHEAIRHGLAPLLYRRVQRLPSEPSPPPDVLARLRDLYVHNELRNASAYAELARVLSAAREAGLEVIVLKGAFLAENVYEDPALRPMLDVDLMVQTAELDRLQSLVRSLGYSDSEDVAPRTQHHLPPLVKPGALPIEVHGTPVRLSSVSPDLGHLWDTARRAKVAGVPVLTLSPEHLLHHLCVHVSYHHRFRVSPLHLHDIAAVLRHYPLLDWDAFADIVRAHGSRRFVSATLAVVERAFPASVPTSQLARYRGTAAEDAVHQDAWIALTSATQPSFPRLYVRLGEIEGAGARARFLCGHLLHLVEHFRRKHGLAQNSPRAYWYFLVRAGTFLRRQGRLTVELLLHGPARGALKVASRRARLARWTEAGDAEPPAQPASSQEPEPAATDLKDHPESSPASENPCVR
jgi:hypothetical protein